MLEFDLLCLSEAELSGDVRDGLLGKHDRSGMNGANTAGKLNVFDRFGEALQATAILLKKTQAWPIDLAVNQEPDQSFMTEHRRERELALRYVEGRDHVAERFVMHARLFFVRRVAHRGVIAIEIQRAH